MVLMGWGKAQSQDQQSQRLRAFRVCKTPLRTQQACLRQSTPFLPHQGSRPGKQLWNVDKDVNVDAAEDPGH